MPQATTLDLLAQLSKTANNKTGVGRIAVTNPGSGYVGPTAGVTITGNGSNATAGAVIAYGGVGTVFTINPGTGYTAVPTVTIAPPETPGGVQATAIAYLNDLTIGQPQPAASYYLANRSLQTLTWSFNNVTALVTIQATLTTNPLDNDWFNVYSYNLDSATDISYYNLPGTFVWLRAVVQNFTQGIISYIKVTY